MTDQCDEEIVEKYYPDWRMARIKFMEDHPATSKALGLKEPPDTYAEYRASLGGAPPPSPKV